MDITFILPTYPWVPVGGYRVVYEYSNELVNRGHNVNIVYPRFMSNMLFKGTKEKYRRYFGRIRDYMIKPKVNWQYIDERVNMYYIHEPVSKNIPDADIVFATAWETAEYVNDYPSIKGQKFYLIQHYETWCPLNRLNATWKLPMQKIVIARWLYKKGVEIGVPENQMEYIPNGIDLGKFKLIKDIEQRPKCVSMLYHKDDWKGSPDGIKALELAKKEYPELKAFLFGTFSPPSTLPKWIKYFKNPAQETLVKEIYNGSSIYLCPSWSEGWHLPPAEAMACGCAVVSTDIDGVKDYAIHNETALLSPPNNPETLAENLLTLLNNDKLRIKLSKAGNKNIQRFTWDNATTKLENLLNKHSG